MAAASALSPPAPPRLTHAHVSPGWRARDLSRDSALDKMMRNANKAVKEHFEAAKPSEKGVFATVEEAMSTQTMKSSTPLVYEMSSFTAQGPRPKMEDAHFFIETEEEILSAVFDGHGGTAVSQFAADYTRAHFFEFLKKHDGNIHAAFESLFDGCQEAIKKEHPGWKEVGTTALICYIDKKSNLIVTATLGDSEATIYRTCGISLKAIPLSCLRNWYTSKDNIRLANAFGVPSRGEVGAPEWMTASTPGSKWLRASGPYSEYQIGLNVSRALGDLESTSKSVYAPEDFLKKKVPLVIHKPKITIQQLAPGDHLILRCDGVTDYLTEEEMCRIIATNQKEPLISEKIGLKALKRMEHMKQGDNVTVITIKIEEKK